MAAGIGIIHNPAWTYPVPKFLYKYFPPERFHVLTDCRLRFTQRQLFEDRREFRPEVRDFGTEEEIRRFIEIDEYFRTIPAHLKEEVVQTVVTAEGLQHRLAELTQGRMVTPDAFVTLCLSEHKNCRRMWDAYAAHGHGFVVEFDTTHPESSMLFQPGRLGRVEYSNEPLPTFLGSYGPDAFFRKHSRYAFEGEWRSIRAISRFTRVVDEPRGENPLYLGRFDPGSVSRLLARSNSEMEQKLRVFASIDARYPHVAVDTV